METRVCKDCNVEQPLENYNLYNDHDRNITYYTYCKKCHSIRNSKNNRKLKAEVINYYSSGKNSCVCCNESILDFLTIDHINGDGSQHRSKNMGAGFYRILKRNNFPDLKLQVLCWNCNRAKKINGICPHKM